MKLFYGNLFFTLVTFYICPESDMKNMKTLKDACQGPEYISLMRDKNDIIKNI